LVGDIDDSISEFKKAVELDPSYKEGYFYLDLLNKIKTKNTEDSLKAINP